jgi:hypothetical protein
MKLIVIGLLALILLSLGSGLVYLFRDKGSTDRTVKALTVRVGLSVALFALLMLTYYFGLIPKQGL